MRSPLTGKSNTFLVKTYQRGRIIDLYKSLIGVDVSRNITSEEIQLYKCLDSGYQFYYPFDLAGDSDFYGILQNFDWYYMPWKWEHDQVASLDLTNLKILEVGCGRAGFLKAVSDKFSCEVTGLELNEDAVKQGTRAGIKVLREDINTHRVSKPNYYDMVCSFQVLEHVPNVREFICGQLDCLKPGGYFVVAVPNNDSFINWDSQNVLNMPPHHMGLWNKKSLESISHNFSLDLVKIDFEPLQAYHVDWYVKIRLIKYFGERIYYRLLMNSIVEKKYRRVIHKNRAAIIGHTILVTYRKR